MNIKVKIIGYLLGIATLGMAAQVNASNAVYVDPVNSFQPNGTTFNLTVKGDFDDETIGGGFTLSWDESVIQILDDNAAILGSLTSNGFEFSNIQNAAPVTTATSSLEILSASFTNFFDGGFNIVTLTFQAVGVGITNADLTLSPFQGEDWVAGDLFSPLSVSYTGATVEVGTVPVPAAAWLFGSGLIGLVGVSRRSKSQRV